MTCLAIGHPILFVQEFPTYTKYQSVYICTILTSISILEIVCIYVDIQWIWFTYPNTNSAQYNNI